MDRQNSAGTGAYDTTAGIYLIFCCLGPGLIFLVFPHAFNTLPASQVWAAMFFMGMTFLAIDSVVSWIIILCRRYWPWFMAQCVEHRRNEATQATVVWLLTWEWWSRRKWFPCVFVYVVTCQFTVVEGNITALADYWPHYFGQKGAQIWRVGFCAALMLLSLPQFADVGARIRLIRR